MKLSDASVHLSPPSPSDFTAHQLLGTGSFGEVYLVEENSSKQLYAMKVLSKDKIHSQNLLKYAFAERAIMVKMTKVNHPYIVKIKYAFQTDESLFMVTQFCSGGDLSQYLELEGAFSESKARGYIAEVICALECLHSHNIIFRDLKPDNVGFDVRGDVKIFDFGLSRVMPSDCNTYDEVFEMSGAGSPRYMAPEVMGEYPRYNLKADVYTYSILMWEILALKKPYAFARSMSELIDYVGKYIVDT